MCLLSYNHAWEAQLQSQMCPFAKGSLKVTKGTGLGPKRDLELEERCWGQQESNGCFAFARVFWLCFKHQALWVFSIPNPMLIFFLVPTGANLGSAWWEWLFIPVVPRGLHGVKVTRSCSPLSVETLCRSGVSACPLDTVPAPLGHITGSNKPNPGWTGTPEI